MFMICHYLSKKRRHAFVKNELMTFKLYLSTAVINIYKHLKLKK